MSTFESPQGDDVEPIEIQLSATDRRLARRQHRPRRANYQAVIALTAIVSGAAGFGVARSTGSDPTTDASTTTTSDESSNESQSANNPRDDLAGSSTTLADSSTVTDPTVEYVIEYSASSDVFEITAGEFEVTAGELSDPAGTYVGPDGIDSRLAGQPVTIVARTKSGLIDLDLTAVGADQVDTAIAPVAGGETARSGVKSAGPDWVLVGESWEPLQMLREGQDPLVISESGPDYVVWPEGERWGWKFGAGDSESTAARIDVDGNVIAGSEIALPSWFGWWFETGSRLVGARGGALSEFSAEGERALARGFPIATGNHTVVVGRCGDKLVCSLFAIDLDTGEERLLGDTDLAANMIDDQMPSISPDDRYLALAQFDGTVIVDLVNGQVIQAIPGYSNDSLTMASAWSNDGRWWFYNDDSDGPTALDTTTGERFPIFDPARDTERWTSLTVRAP